MAFHNPTTRANYEPNSWGAEEGGPREDPENGFTSVDTEETGPKGRIRAESFADHYSQARQFYISQTPVEQSHIADAFTFELSKVKRADIRARMVSHLLNVDEELAKRVAEKLRLDLPKPAKPAKAPLADLPESPALSILKNGPQSFAGRKVGILVTDGTDASLLAALQDALKKEGAMAEIVAPRVGGIKASDGSMVEADEKIDGAPSVVYDAVAVIPSDDGVAELAKMPPARDFVSDAFAHYKFVAYSDAAKALFEKAGLPEDLDDGFLQLGSKADADGFVKACRGLRFWERSGAA